YDEKDEFTWHYEPCGPDPDLKTCGKQFKFTGKLEGVVIQNVQRRGHILMKIRGDVPLWKTAPVHGMALKLYRAHTF
ncbi:mucin-19-like, partial [Arapaima gigas]